MKSFYGGTYIEKELLEENRIYHPIRLEYYKIEEEDYFYGIEVIKTEYSNTGIKVEKELIHKITKDEEEIIFLLEKLKIGSVMPSVIEETIKELQKEEYYILT